MMIRKRDKQLLRRIKRLAQTECANYSKGKCLENDASCEMFNHEFSTIHDGVIDCDYLIRNVLPAEPETATIVWYEIFRQDEDAGEGWKQCSRCHRPFIPACNRQKYCKACGEEAKRIRIRLKQRRYRERMKVS